MDSLNRWQDRAQIVAGIWLSAAPWLLGLPEAAAWCAVIVGMFVILLATDRFVLPDPVDEWGNVVLGVGLLISPWVWDYADHKVATVNALVFGLMITGLAAWALERLFMRNRMRHS
jgi:hypothetical protein